MVGQLRFFIGWAWLGLAWLGLACEAGFGESALVIQGQAQFLIFNPSNCWVMEYSLIGLLPLIKQAMVFC